MNLPGTTDFAAIVQLLADAGVRFILIGGLAMSVQGVVYSTEDVDIVYSREPANLLAIERALERYKPYLRGAPEGLPFVFDAETIRRGLNFTLTTTIGALDLLGEVPGGGSYEQLLPFSEGIEVYGRRIQVVTLEKLLVLKRASGRPKDLNVTAQIEMVLSLRRKDAAPPEPR